MFNKLSNLIFSYPLIFGSSMNFNDILSQALKKVVPQRNYNKKLVKTKFRKVFKKIKAYSWV